MHLSTWDQFSTFQVDFLEISFSKPRRKCTRLPCGLNIKQAVHVVRLLATSRRDLRRRTFAYAVPNENDEAKKAASHDCNLDSMALHSDNNGSSKYSDVEVVASISCLEDAISQTVENLKSQGSILDKLKAVHLHLLASERWNASRLKLCHRCASLLFGHSFLDILCTAFVVFSSACWLGKL